MPKILIAIVALGLATSARADDWSKTFQISDKPVLAIRTSDANIRVDTWDQNSIETHVSTRGVKIGDGGIRIEAHQAGDMVDVEVRYPHEHMNFGMDHRSVNIDVHMPRAGSVSLHTGDGSIELSHFKGAMELQSGDGHQKLEEVDGTLHAHTGDGSIHVAGRFDGLDAVTGDGKIEAQVLPGSVMTSSWTLHTGDGNIGLQLPEGFSADVELHTGDGHINLDLPVTVENKISSNNIRGKLNGGGKLLTLHTGDGSIELGKLAGAL